MLKLSEEETKVGFQWKIFNEENVFSIFEGAP